MIKLIVITRLIILSTILLKSTLALAKPPNQEPESLYTLSLEKLLQIKISGSTLVDASINQVPAAVSVFTRDQIQRLGLNTIAELMNFVPGFQSQRSADNGLYTMASSRNRRTEAVSSEILVLVDGFRTQSHYHHGSSLFLELPLSNIERIEFIRGSGSAIYGSNAMMGIINIITVKNQNNVSLDAGGEGNKGISLNLGKENRNSSFNLSVDSHLSSGKEYSLNDAYSVNPIAVSDPYKNTNAIVKTSYGKLELHLQYRNWESKEFYVLESLDPNYNRVGFDYLRYGLNYTFEFDKFSSRVSTYYVDNEAFVDGKFSDYGAFSQISSPPSDEPLAYQSTTISHEKNISVHNKFELDDQNQFLFGFEWRKEETDKLQIKLNFDYLALLENQFPISYDQNYIIAEIFPENFRSQTVLGGYAQWLAEFDGGNSLTLGVRYDQYKEIDESNITPRIAWVHEFNESHSIKILYASAFRAPSLDNLNADSSWSRGSPTLKAETVQTGEFIWLGNYKKTFWTLGYFSSSFSDPILLEIPEVGDNTTRVLVNSEHDDIAGIEFEINYEVNSNWLMRATATYIPTADEITFRESSELASLELNYSERKWNANIGMAWRGKRETYDENETDLRRSLDAYCLSFAKLQYKLSDRFNLYTQASNLLDDKIYYASPGSQIPQGVPSRGFEIETGIHVQF